jgi:hypothetical protein
MHGFIKRFADGLFYPEEVAILTAAFDDAWAKLQAGQALVDEQLPLQPREKFWPSKSSGLPSEGP